MKNVFVLIILCISVASMSGTKEEEEIKVIQCTYEYEVMKCNK